jgi:3-hydroxyacyl-[acyl-carrier-protein] dehydratase
MAVDRTLCERILAKVPQQPPFRFVDEILELDGEHIVGTYRFKEDEYFYQGHFPGLPVTPGVILVETMAQTGVVAFGLYLAEQDAKMARLLADAVTLFSLADSVEFTGVVRPGEPVVITGRKVYFRGGQLKVACTMTRPDGEVVCTGTLAGKAIPRTEFARTADKSAREEHKG